jgi:hypothetical protein
MVFIIEINARETNFKILQTSYCIELSLSKIHHACQSFENHKDAKSSVIGIKETLRHLSDGKPLGMFPAGEFLVTR